MRQIEFRALDSTGKWVFGYFSKDYEGTAYITTLDGVDTSTVQEKTLGQFTGLVDKNENKIFDGDILTREERGCDNSCQHSTYVVIWDDGKYMLKTLKSKIFRKDSVVYVFSSKIEVIGNIHQNPELL